MGTQKKQGVPKKMVLSLVYLYIYMYIHALFSDTPRWREVTKWSTSSVLTWEVGWSMRLPMQLANSNSLSTFNRPNWHSAHLKPPILLIPAWSATHILLVGFLLIAFALISRRVRRTGKVLVIWDGRTGGTGSFHVLLTVLALLVPCIVFQVSFVVSIMGTLLWRIPERVRENMHLMGNRDCARGNKRLQLGLKTGEH